MAMMVVVVVMMVAMMMMVVATYGSEGVLGDVVALQVNSGERGVCLHFICFSFVSVFFISLFHSMFLFSHIIGVIFGDVVALHSVCRHFSF